MNVADQFSAAGSLWVGVVKQAKRDLVLNDTRNASLAAKYFFLEPADGDDGDIKTFAGLCAATRINANSAAKAIFSELNPDQQERVRNLLRDVGFEGIRPVIM